METASSWDSFKNTLVKVLGEFNPTSVLEYGPGVSTIIMQDYPSIQFIETIEHDVAWFYRWKSLFGTKVNLVLEENLSKYPYHIKDNNYDLYFIDGKEREICLDLCNRSSGIVILHDSERESYQSHIKKYKYIFMEDSGHTCVMTNVDEFEKRLESIFENISSPT